MSRLVTVHVEEDHLSKLVRHSPVAATAELVWNALDADASEVRVRVIENALGGVESVEVEDDGHGITFQDAMGQFSALGGSWKKTTGRSKRTGRILHGREGQGRWRAYALGDRVRWQSVTEDDAGHRWKITIEARRARLGEFLISEPVPTNDSVGTVVLVDQMCEGTQVLLDEVVMPELITIFAPYLEEYPVSVAYRSFTLDPHRVQRNRSDYDLHVPAIDPETAHLRIIEWTMDVSRALYLCDEEGSVLEKVSAGIQAPNFNFTAYLHWAGFRERANVLALANFGVAAFDEVIEAARERLRQHFRDRAGEVRAALIKEWKTEQIYPYSEEASNPLEAAQRELFDIVALTAAPAIVRSRDQSARKLTLRLIREALEQDPGSLHRVISEVLDLPREKLEELSSLLTRTPLTAIIAATRRIADRLDFLTGLSALLFDPPTKETLLERSQLHRILAAETWIFGEQFNLMVDDQSLTAVLQRHLKELKRDELAPQVPVLDESGHARIVDLMLARSLRLNTERREHLVVELKRPAVVLKADELVQIERYAFAVAEDERFEKTGVIWDFVLIGNSMDAFAMRRAEQRDRPPGLISDPSSVQVRVWVKTWAQILAECEHRLKFVQQALQYAPSQDAALDYLRRTHSSYLPDSIGHKPDSGVVRDQDKLSGVSSDSPAVEARRDPGRDVVYPQGLRG